MHDAKELRKWLKANLGPRCLAPLTSQDALALDTAIAAIQLYNYCDAHCEGLALQAFRNAVHCMQKSTQELAFHAIAYSMDWPDRARIWHLVGLTPIANLRRCTEEPRQ